MRIFLPHFAVYAQAQLLFSVIELTQSLITDSDSLETLVRCAYSVARFRGHQNRIKKLIRNGVASFPIDHYVRNESLVGEASGISNAGVSEMHLSISESSSRQSHSQLHLTFSLPLRIMSHLRAPNRGCRLMPSLIEIISEMNAKRMARAIIRLGIADSH